VARFGKWGTRLWELARGIDESPVVPSQKRKSWSSENTFSTDITIEEVADYIREEAQKLWDSLQPRRWWPHRDGQTPHWRFQDRHAPTDTRRTSIERR